MSWFTNTPSKKLWNLIDKILGREPKIKTAKEKENDKNKS